jgi:Ran GTPase-activating protein (RanGAP) involved in mRNA processing and transport
MINRLDPKIVRELDLSSNNIGNPTFDDLYNLLTNSARLTKLVLNNCRLSKAAVSQLCAGMIENTSIRFLGLA